MRLPHFRALLFRLSFGHGQIFVSLPEIYASCSFMYSISDFCALVSRYSCVHSLTLVRSCPDTHAFTRFCYVGVQTFVRSPHFRALMFSYSYVPQTFVRSCSDFFAFVHDQNFLRSQDFHAFIFRFFDQVQTFVRSSDFLAVIFRPSCVHHTFVRSCSDFRAFMSRSSRIHQIFLRSDFHAFIFRLFSFGSRLLCVHQIFLRSCSDFRAFTALSCAHVQASMGQVQTFLPSFSNFRAFIFRLSYVHV